MLAAFSETDLKIVAIVAVIFAVLLYRLFRREPRDRIVRLGLFIERVRNGDDTKKESFDHAEPRDAETHDVVPDDETTRIEWPRREDP